MSKLKDMEKESVLDDDTSDIDTEAWAAAHRSWHKVSSLIGFENRKSAFINGFYLGYKAQQEKDVCEKIDEVEF